VVSGGDDEKPTSGVASTAQFGGGMAANSEKEKGGVRRGQARERGDDQEKQCGAQARACRCRVNMFVAAR
jgi:hypothetical protein